MRLTELPFLSEALKWESFHSVMGEGVFSTCSLLSRPEVRTSGKAASKFITSWDLTTWLLVFSGLSPPAQCGFQTNPFSAAFPSPSSALLPSPQEWPQRDCLQHAFPWMIFLLGTVFLPSRVVDGREPRGKGKRGRRVCLRSGQNV